MYEVCKLSNETGNVALDLATLRRRDLEGLWMIGLLRKGVRQGLTVMDLYKSLDCDKSVNVGDKLEKNWEMEVSSPHNTFHCNFRSLQPVVLSNLIKLFSRDNADKHTDLMYIYGSILIVLTILVVFLFHHANFGQSVVGMRIRIACSTLVYRKLTRLSQQSLGQATAGQVVNLLSNDVNRFDLVTQALHHLWIMPFQVALVSYFIWEEVGISFLAGVLTMAIFSLPGQGYLGKLTGQLRLKIANKTDYRVKLMNEIISGIHVIKMYAWEKPFEKVIKNARKTEIDDITRTSYLRGLYTSCMVFIERATLCLTVICFVLLGNVITADIVFSLAQFYNILQSAMAIYYPMAISYGAEALISIKRLEEFLVLEEKQESCVKGHNKKEVELVKLCASWVPKNNVLEDINLHIPPNSLVAIVGPVGSGKSSLLQVLLGELPPSAGKVYLGGEVSYASQEAWLFAASVRSNILFGQPYNRTLYDKVVQVCALQKDFQQFPEETRPSSGNGAYR
ncbi:hypothetical protein NQ318_003767 [Aromia moschata]|uniref:ABC transmembrane type-1 domain-containing protein n=1 Tax=Aromia moschata TaxID=1265417 RepID=A0AAV8YI43_9CUCU|nr:hypothetical protein NQ318_003767 [Aromia moschata]